MCALVCVRCALRLRVALILTFRSLFGEKIRTSTNSNLEPRAEIKVTMEAPGRYGTLIALNCCPIFSAFCSLIIPACVNFH